MLESFATTAHLIQLQDRVFHRVIEGLTEEQARQRPAEIGNSPYFILGHVVTSRYSIAQLLGIPAAHPWGKMFDRGSEIPPSGEGPSLEELTNAWSEVTGKIVSKLDGVTQEQLDKEAPMEVAPFSKTCGGLTAFLAFHEAYHLGQLGYLRRINGLERAFG